jgi:chromosome segregation ATPase
MKKLDVKSWIIVVLLIISLVFVGKWYFKGDDVAKSKIKELEGQIELIQKEKAQRDANIKVLQDQQKDLEATIAVKTQLVEDLARGNVLLANQVAYAQKGLEETRKKLKETQDKIAELLKNPVKREGDDLLNSLKNKTK